MPSRGGKSGRKQTYAALLRGINLGSHNKISMSDLRALFESLGAENVKTYVQSGNVVFRSAGGAPDLERSIEKRISGELGLDVRVLLRTKAQLAKVVRHNPFLAGAPPQTPLYVTFLAEKPAPARVRELDPNAFQPETF